MDQAKSIISLYEKRFSGTIILKTLNTSISNQNKPLRKALKQADQELHKTLNW